MKMQFKVFLNIVLVLAGTVSFAQEPVKPAAEVEGLFSDKDPKLN
jgi:hypothetical protein